MVYMSRKRTPSTPEQDETNIKDRIFLHSTRTLSERCTAASTCVSNLGIEFPAVVDDLADSTERAYIAWPDRLYVIDRDGLVAYKSKPGPYGFHPEEVACALPQLLPTTQAAQFPHL